MIKFLPRFWRLNFDMYVCSLVLYVAYGRLFPEPRKETHLPTKGDDNQENSSFLAASCKTIYTGYHSMIVLTLTICAVGES